MRTREWVTLCGGILFLLGGAVWAISPSEGEKALYKAAKDCGVDESFIYYGGDQSDQLGKVIGVDYSTDGNSRDFACVQRQLKNMGITKIGPKIDA